METIDGTPTVAKMRLEVRGAVPGLDQAGFAKAADGAKQNCPVSRALKGIPTVELVATLES
jgi:osmotically inducible protein OsmC